MNIFYDHIKDTPNPEQGPMRIMSVMRMVATVWFIHCNRALEMKRLPPVTHVKFGGFLFAPGTVPITVEYWWMNHGLMLHQLARQVFSLSGFGGLCAEL